MTRTALDKIWSTHVVKDLGSGSDLVAIDRILLHERTGGIALKSLASAGRTVQIPRQTFATMDHVVDTLPGRTDSTMVPSGSNFIKATREATRTAGITLFDLDDPRQGIVHVISPEQGIVLPGLTLVCPDSHTCSQGAVGALAWGIGSTEAEHALATGTLRVARPKAMRVTVSGSLATGVTAKDLALHLLARFGSSGGRGFVVEYAGAAVRALDIEARLTLCNMAAEFGAFSAFIAPDDSVFEFLFDRPYAPRGAMWDEAVRHWRTLTSDEGAAFEAEIAIDGAKVVPIITWGTSPQQAIPLDAKIPDYCAVAERESRETYDRAIAYMGLTAGEPIEGLAIDAAFIGSCTNSRLSDLRRAAAVLRGRKVARGVRAICVPGSTQVKAAAEAEGIDKVFIAAGFEWREAGCSMCFFAGGESFGVEERVISSTNRNFESRQGPRTRSHLASPEVVAASAVRGSISHPKRLEIAL